MKARLLSLLTAALLAGAGLLPAQDLLPAGGDTLPAPAPFEPHDIFHTLNQPDSTTAAVVRVYQDERIGRLFLDRQTPATTETIAGFRVQVFSSNHQQTAKTEAFRIKDEVKTSFPGTGVYESYSSPFWKVRVGDFRTRDEAQALLTALMDSFPDIRREMYIVPDNILTVTNNNEQ